MNIKNVKRYIPVLVNDFLKSRKHFHIKWDKNLDSEIYELDYDGLVIIVDIIYRVAGTRNIDNDNFVEIQSDFFHKILHNNYKLYLDYLLDNKIVISDGSYVVGEKSIGYKINYNYISDDKLTTINIDNNIFNKRTLKSIKYTNDKIKISSKHSKNYFKSFKIDLESATDYLFDCYHNQIPDHKDRILNKYTKDILYHKLKQINNGELWINRSNTNGRINSNLSSLNSNYKQFIIGYDISLDIVSSQPMLLNVLINKIKVLQGIKNFKSNSLITLSSYEYKMMSKTLSSIEMKGFNENLKNLNLPSEKEQIKWIELTKSGQLYEYFQKIVKDKMGMVITRPQAKEIVFQVMYSSSQLNNDYKKMFNSTFPSIYKFLSSIKNMYKIKRSHKVLPIMMQCIESFIFVENILPELDRLNIPYLFIHDSVLIKEEDFDRTDLVIQEVFYEFGVDVKIKKEYLKNK